MDVYDKRMQTGWILILITLCIVLVGVGGLPRDIIAIGTPPSVSFCVKSSVCLDWGDMIEVGCEG